jgi:hypothetical protein
MYICACDEALYLEGVGPIKDVEVKLHTFPIAALYVSVVSFCL